MVGTKVGTAVWSRFLNSTSVGGLSQFNNASTGRSKAYWALLFVAGMIATCYSVRQVHRDYTGYEVCTVIE